ncbi:Thymidylate synthase complementing protein [Sanguibacter gelidistatuariae]|uniref:Thymidylate synthase complementing protein n=1 Tax=Sanguibacter gelidistatuariae TaxID=1814289 RepID=A0A1G6GS83_9MICO|nr:FAD-dependent thymidylate synthase [Sanguibacter gelidistatuariae]SDB84838.1 Thymidylate synthase complementing protein [Sanguibacter gelidistatuariae]
MGYRADVVADSIAPDGDRLTTMVVTFPRIVLAEVNTHRALSRNSASSRAIPVTKQIRAVLETPFVPDEFPAYSTGMQPRRFLDEGDHGAARRDWLAARDSAVGHACKLLTGDAVPHPGDEDFYDVLAAAVADPAAPSVAKEIANRLLEPFMWHTAIISATDWSNFFGLRCHPDAQRQIRLTAEAMREALAASTPSASSWGTWHLPFVTDEERTGALPATDLARVSAARCARVSYETHWKESSVSQDLERYGRLAGAGHLSPMEHAAVSEPGRFANYSGWRQLRLDIPFESDFAART